jgi:hypothetical protein
MQIRMSGEVAVVLARLTLKVATNHRSLCRPSDEP